MLKYRNASDVYMLGLTILEVCTYLPSENLFNK